MSVATPDAPTCKATNDGELVVAGSADGGRCHKCGSDEFEQVALVPAD